MDEGLAAWLERSGFAGNNALDQACSLSSDGCSDREGGRVWAADGVSSKASQISIPASLGMSKFGAALFEKVARTARAKAVSGRFQDP